MSPLLRPGYDHAKAHARTLPLHKIQKGPYFQCEKIKPVNSSLQNNNNNKKTRQTPSSPSSVKEALMLMEYNRGGRKRWLATRRCRGHGTLDEGFFWPALCHENKGEVETMSLFSHNLSIFLTSAALRWVFQSMWGFSTPPWGGEREEARR